MAHISWISEGRKMTVGDQLRLTVSLAIPSMIGMIASIAMEFIDASMVGHLGEQASASIGLVATTLWLFWGVCHSGMRGFSVLTAHSLGAADADGARDVVRQGLTMAIVVGTLMAAIGLLIARHLPHWLGGTGDVCADSTIYFSIFVGALPLLTVNYLCSGLLRAAGCMKVAAAANTAMCAMDVVFNYLFIYKAGLGVMGAAMGTVCAEVCTVLYLLYKVWQVFGLSAAITRKGLAGLCSLCLIPYRDTLRRWLKIATPLTIEHAVICGAQIVSTIIVAPLGMAAIAANSFAVTAESLCYMPGYGIAEAASTLVGQSYGAKRRKTMCTFAYLCIGVGMVVMSVMGALMWLFAPEMMGILSPVDEIRQLGTEALRIEAWAEPLYGASIVAYSAFVAAADTVVPVAFNFCSIWIVRLSLAAMLAPTMGLAGVWLAMAIELSFRGTLFLLRLTRFNKIKLC